MTLIKKVLGLNYFTPNKTFLPCYKWKNLPIEQKLSSVLRNYLFKTSSSVLLKSYLSVGFVVFLVYKDICCLEKHLVRFGVFAVFAVSSHASSLCIIMKKQRKLSGRSVPEFFFFCSVSVCLPNICSLLFNC